MKRSAALDPATVDAVHALARAAQDADGVAPLSEDTLLTLGRTPEPGGATATHLIVGGEGELTAYAHLGADGSSEVVVAPSQRRRGVGRMLLDAVLQDDAAARVWAHGNLPAAQALAAAAGLEIVRELWQMTLDVEAHPPAEPLVPHGFRVRAFEPGRDERAWLEVNARAFNHHPEQGRMTLTDLQERMAQPWFDPAGLILIEEMPTGALAASHWTKIEQGSAGGADQGEVYVVAVDPAYQGRGLGGVITQLGLRHLAASGVRTIDLYVEGDNTPAIATYRRVGFQRSALDVMYSRAVHEGLSR